jgi:hypothetical protein
MPEDILVGGSATGIQGGESMDDAKYPTMHKTTPTTKIFPV